MMRMNENNLVIMSRAENFGGSRNEKNVKFNIKYYCII